MVTPGFDAEPAAGPVVVGIGEPGHAMVVAVAADYARRLGAPLVCAVVDEQRFAVERLPDGSERSVANDPDLLDGASSAPPPPVLDAIRAAADGVSWSVLTLAGGPAQEIAGLADLLGASLIVVGARRGVRAELAELLTGSVAVQLVREQSLPVLVVPPQDRRHRRGSELPE